MGIDEPAADGPFSGITGSIVSAAIEVHRVLGPGLLESAYEACLAHELVLRGHSVERQVSMGIEYKGLKVPLALRLDLLVDNQVVVELKVADTFSPEFEAQVLSYLRFAQIRVGLLINFKMMPVAKRGIRRYLYDFSSVPSV